MVFIDLPIWYSCEYAKTIQPIAGAVTHLPATHKFTWRTTNKKKTAAFRISKPPFIPGWYMVEVNITANKEHLDSSFYLDYTSVKSQAYPLLVINNRPAKRIIYIKKDIKGILFDPAESQVNFTVNTLRYTKLTQKFALKCMKKKLFTFEPSFVFTSIGMLWKNYATFYKKQHKSEANYSSWVAKRENSLWNEYKTTEHHISFFLIIFTDDEIDFSLFKPTIDSVHSQKHTSWSLLFIGKEPFSNKKDFFSVTNGIPKEKIFYSKKTTTKEIAREIHNFSPGARHYLIYLQHDTQLSTLTLSALEKKVMQNPDCLLLYGDEDQISPQGERENPIFKPNWNPDLLLSQNYIGYAQAMSIDIFSTESIKLDKLGVWVYKLTLSGLLNSENVIHIPLILTHKLVSITSHSTDVKRKAAELLALKQKLKKYKAIADIGKTKQTFKVSWPIPPIEPFVSIIIPTRNQAPILKRAIESIVTLTNYSNYEILIIDNQSDEPEALEYFEEISSQSIQVIKYDKEFNYSAINNFAVKYSRGEILALVNNDVEVITPDWLKEMVSHSLRPNIGCVGAMLYYPDNRIQHAGVIIGLGGCAGHSHKFYSKGSPGYANRLHSVQNYSAVTGACLVVRKSTYLQAGGLNEEKLSVAFNDVDFCLKVQALGYKNVWTPWAELYHHESISRGTDDSQEKRARLTKEVNYMRETWNTASTLDPHYSKFLTRIREDFTPSL